MKFHFILFQTKIIIPITQLILSLAKFGSDIYNGIFTSSFTRVDIFIMDKIKIFLEFYQIGITHEALCFKLKRLRL